MWRWLNGLRRAIRQHIQHRPATASGAVLEEDVTEHGYEDVNNKQRETDQHFRDNKQQGHQDSHGPNCQWWKCGAQFNFWSLLHQNHALEALGWGAAVVLGIQLSKHPKWVCPQNEEYPGKYCLLYRVALALPGQTRRSIVADDNKVHIPIDARQQSRQTTADQDQEKSDDPVAKVIKEFEEVCKRYTGIARNIEGNVQAREGHMMRAVESWTAGNDLGYSKSRFNLGLCYEIGKGVKKDLKKAAECYSRAGSDGHPQALYNLALMYLEGRGVVKNPKEALVLLEKAAEYGLKQAQTYLGIHYTTSESRNLKKAVSLFQEAASQGDPEAQYFLGICYEQGLGVEVNECKAADLYAQSASGGHDGAMYNLAVFHEYGLGGLPEDTLTAEELYRKSAKLGNEHAQNCLDQSDAEEAVSQWEAERPACRMDLNFVDIEQQPVLRNTEDEDKSKLGSSASTPSLTDYIRKHLSEFQIGTDPLSIFFTTGGDKLFTQTINGHIVDLKSADSEMLDSRLRIPTEASTRWEPQYGSPKVSHDTSPDSTPVSFSLGADEDDIESLQDLHSDLSFQRESVEDYKPSHAVLNHKTSTMPNLHLVTCN